MENNRCSIPFVGYFQADIQNNTISPCCKVRKSAINDTLITDDTISIRKSIIDNEKNPLCSECWKVEDTDGPSFRKRYGLNNLEWDILDIYSPPKKIILNFSNKCQMMCIYCGENSSTMWQSAKNIIPVVPSPKSKDFERLLALEDFIGISISGGEPMLEDRCVDYLLNLPFSKDRDLSLVTNLSYGLATLDKLEQIIRRHPNIVIGCSIDAIGDNISRRYLNWELWDRNFRILADNLQSRIGDYKNAFIYTKSTLGAMNYRDIQGVIEYILNFRIAGYKNISFDINPLTDDTVTCLSSMAIDNSVQIVLEDRYKIHLSTKEKNLIILSNKMIKNSRFDELLSLRTLEHLKKYAPLR